MNLTFTSDKTCWKALTEGEYPERRCCCNCTHHHPVNGHPWVTKSSILTPTGLSVCTVLSKDNKDRAFIASSGHGLCEEWTAIAPQ